MATGKWAYKQRRDCVRTEDGLQLRISRTKNNARPFGKIRIVAVEYCSRHERLTADNPQAIDFRNDLRVIREIIKLRSSSRVPMLVRLNVECKVKVHTIEETEFAFATSSSTLLQHNGG